MDTKKVNSEAFDHNNPRHVVAAEPQNNDKEIVEAAQCDAELQAFWEEMKTLDEAVKQTSETPVPGDLEAKLFAIADEQIALEQEEVAEVAETNVVPFNTSKKNNFFQLAMVASIAFVIGLSFTFFNQQPSLKSGTDIALEHVYHELEYTKNRDRIVSLGDVNAKLASFGGAMNTTPAKVTFANFCFFEDKKSLHLVLDTEEGQVTIFVTPSDLEAPIDNQFGDERFNGRSWKVQEVDVTIIGDKERISKDKMEYLKNSMQFSA